MLLVPLRGAAWEGLWTQAGDSAKVPLKLLRDSGGRTGRTLWTDGKDTVDGCRDSDEKRDEGGESKEGRMKEGRGEEDWKKGLSSSPLEL